MKQIQDHKKSLPRKQQIARMIISGKTYQQVSGEMGISRQRVQQLNRPDTDTILQLKVRAKNRCEKCDIPLMCGHIHHISENVIDYHGLNNLQYLCVSCHTKTDKGEPATRICPNCGLKFGRKNSNLNKFCSDKCRHDFIYVTIFCPACGREIEISKSRYKFQQNRQENFYCSQRCNALSKNEDYKPLN